MSRFTDGTQAKEALNITEVDIPNGQRVALVIYSTPRNLDKYEAANIVVFTVFNMDNSTEGIILFDTTRRAEDLLSTVLIYADREAVELNKEAGLTDTQIYNSYQFFTLTKAQVVGASKALLETLQGYNILSTQSGVVQGDAIKTSFPDADLSDIGDGDTVAYVSFVPQGDIEEMDFVQAIVGIGFDVDPSVDFVLVNNQQTLQAESLVSLYYTDRVSYERDLSAQTGSFNLTHIEYPYSWEETDGAQE